MPDRKSYTLLTQIFLRRRPASFCIAKVWIARCTDGCDTISLALAIIRRQYDYEFMDYTVAVLRKIKQCVNHVVD